MNYLDLTLFEFLSVITRWDDVFEMEILYVSKEKTDCYLKMEGTLKEFTDFTQFTDAPIELKKSILRSVLETKNKIFNKDLSDIEIYNYLQNLTDNFNKDKTKKILEDVVITRDMYSAHLEYESMEIYKKNNWEIPYDEMKKTDILKNIETQGKTFFIPNYKKMLAKTHLLAFYDIDKIINLLERKLNDIPNIQTNLKPKEIKEPLFFTKLFFSPYSEKIDLLLEQLRTIGLTNEENKWREWEPGEVEKNETSKFYYYLKQKKVLNDYDKTPALICFNKKFGIEVYKDKETPKTERFVQIKTLTSSENTAIKPKLLDKFDTVFSKWFKKIELK